MFLLSYRKESESLGERERLWEHESTAQEYYYPKWRMWRSTNWNIKTVHHREHFPEEKCPLKTHFPIVSPPCWSVKWYTIKFLFFFFWNIVRFITPGRIKPHKNQIKRSCWYFFSNDTIKFMLMLLFEKSLLGRYPFVSSASVRLNSYLSIIACLQKLSTVTLCFAISTPFNSGGSVLIVPGETI